MQSNTTAIKIAKAVVDMLNLQISRGKQLLLNQKKIGVDLTYYYGTIWIDAFLRMRDVPCKGSYMDILQAVGLLVEHSPDFVKDFNIEARESGCIHIQVQPWIKLTEPITLNETPEMQAIQIPSHMDLESLV